MCSWMPPEAPVTHSSAISSAPDGSATASMTVDVESPIAGLSVDRGCVRTRFLEDTLLLFGDDLVQVGRFRPSVVGGEMQCEFVYLIEREVTAFQCGVDVRQDRD